jgi:acetyl/propionyl-CoA carboxylase alpha subunit
VHVPAGGMPAATAKAYRALSEFRIEGVSTNVPFLQSLLADPAVRQGDVHTRFIEEQAADLLAAGELHPQRHFGNSAGGTAPGGTARTAAAPGGTALSGAVVDATDPLAVLSYGKSDRGKTASAEPDEPGADGATPVRSPILGTVTSVAVHAGGLVRRGAPLLILEAMKLEHVVPAPCDGTVRAVCAEPGETIGEGQVVALIEESAAVPEQRQARKPPIPAISARISPRCSNGTGSPVTRRGPRLCNGGGRPASGPRGRTSPTWSIREPSSSTAR